MSRRSMSSEHASQSQPLTQEELENSLEEFESKLQDDHAFGMRWLLQDVRETVVDRKLSFFEAPFVEKGQSSPWTSCVAVQVRPRQGEPAHIDKLESFVSSIPSLASKIWLIRIGYVQKQVEQDAKPIGWNHNHHRSSPCSKILFSY